MGLLLLGISLTACASQPTTSPTITPFSTEEPGITPTLPITVSETPEPTVPPITPTPIPWPDICSPISELETSDLENYINNPYHPPSDIGSDEPHQGVDFAIPYENSQILMEGVPVSAVIEGTVILSQDDKFPYGNTVIIETNLNTVSSEWFEQLQLPSYVPNQNQHTTLTCPETTASTEPDLNNLSLYTLYAHLKEPSSLTPGENVICGQSIGSIGNTGNSINPHLHLEMRIGPANLAMNAMAHYDPAANLEEMDNYCTWRVKGLYQLIDPMLVVNTPNTLEENIAAPTQSTDVQLQPYDETNPSTQCNGFVNTYAANIRSGPDTIYPVIQPLYQDTELIITGISSDEQWYIVSTATINEGWISTQLINTDIANCSLNVIQAPPAPPTEEPTPLPEGPLFIGFSTQERAIEVYHFGTGATQRLIVAGIHGGYESNTTALAYQLIDYIENNPNVIPEHVTLYILPLLNPDGYALSHGAEGRANANGVDLNRNWEINWQADWPRNGCWDILPITAGYAPGSEPETKALMSFIYSHPIDAMISYHSAALGIFPGINSPSSDSLAQALSNVSPYAYPPVATGCQYTGQLIDWTAARGIASVDIELANHHDTDFSENLNILNIFLNWQQ